MSSMLADVDQRRHRRTARGRPASRCRPPARPARPTTTTTPGSSASRRTSSPASGSASISRRRSLRTAMPAISRCRSGRAFMKRATKGDKPDWFERPPTSSASTSAACRESCRTPAATASRCVDTDGQLEKRSMIYTEYFVKGTQPTTICPLHESRRSSIAWPAFRQGRRHCRCSADAARPAAAASASTIGHAGAIGRRRPKCRQRTAVEEPKKKRGSGRGSSAGDDDERKKARRTEEGRRAAEG